ncbi:MAG: hypothetical protein MRJ68_20180 [Nitrospira sp.]|nr:hypothetical protein [Nitrospira sp.]
MSTPDGISGEDWDVVHDLSLKIVNAEAESEENIYTNQLLQYLDELEAKYGALPSILATRADYVSDTKDQAALYRQAYALAEASHDITNLKEIAHSLAELYIDDLQDPSQGQIWIARLSEHISSSPDKTLSADLERLRENSNRIARQ